jgi:hypothetical protein
MKVLDANTIQLLARRELLAALRSLRDDGVPRVTRHTGICHHVRQYFFERNKDVGFRIYVHEDVQRQLHDMIKNAPSTIVRFEKDDKDCFYPVEPEHVYKKLKDAWTAASLRRFALLHYLIIRMENE